jgi:glyoxylase-like metal-dependent hydrolase (beta-lactamase superfamily II)
MLDAITINGDKTCHIFYRYIYAPVSSNMYIYIIGDEAICFDAIISDEAYRLLIAKGIKTLHLFLTHEHYDHTHGVLWLKQRINTIVYCNKNCRYNLSTKKRSNPQYVARLLSIMDMNDGRNRCSLFKENVQSYNIKADYFLEDNQVCMICGHSIQAIYVPCHSQGSCLYLFDNSILFSGDTMILGSRIIIGNNSGNKIELLKNAISILKALPNDIVVLPGHGNKFNKKDFNFEVYNV